MLRARIIPCLLVAGGRLIKTTKFADPKYVGDPINAVKIFNEKEADELIVLDISATSERRPPDLSMIRNLARECRMPLCYGGGVSSVEQAKEIIGLGSEKVAIGTVAIESPGIISEIADAVGSQSVVVVMDVKANNGLRSGYEVFARNGTVPTGREPSEYAAYIESQGAGEIVINSIDNDGLMNGYDMNLVDMVMRSTGVPITALGGAGSLDDIGMLIDRYGAIGAAAGSLFVFKGVYRAVLISYPSFKRRARLLAAH